MKRTIFAVACASLALVALPQRALAAAPGLLYNPTPNQPGVELVLGASVTPGIAEGSIDISEDPANPGDGGDTPASLTTVFCTLGGDSNIEFASIPSFSFQGNVTGGPSIDISCTQDATLITTATASCFEKRGGISQPQKDFDIQCPATGTAAAPELDASPAPGSTLQMSATSPSNASQGFTISNSGSSNLSVTSITGLASPFSVSPPNATITPGNGQLFTVTCNGATPGVFIDSLTVNTNDADESTVAYNVDCTINSVAGQEFDATPPPPGPIELANTPGSPATTSTITVTNIGSGTLNISNLSALAAPLTRSIGNTTLTAGASTDITIGCASAGATSSSQVLTFNTDDPDDGEGTINFNVSCNVTAGTSPEFTATPNPPGPVAISTATGVQGTSQVSIQNVGTANLTVAQGTISATGFTIQLTGLPLNLAPGAIANVQVACQSGVANNYAGSFGLTTNDANEGNVGFTVNCNVAAGAAPEFDSTPPSPLAITTNQGVVGTANVNVRNLGTASLGVIANPSGAPFTVLPASLTTIAPGANQNFSVRCQSGTPGDYTGTITFVTNDSNEGSVPYTVNCRVNLVAPEFDSTPRAFSVFSFYAKSTEIVSVSIRIFNLGNATLTYTLSGLSGPISSSPSGGPFNLAPGANQNIVVSCNGALLAGNAAQILDIVHNDTGESPARYGIDCRQDIRLDAGTVLRALLNTPMLTDDATLLLENGFE